GRAAGGMPPDRWVSDAGGADHCGLPTPGEARHPHRRSRVERGEASRARAAARLLRELPQARRRARSDIDRLPVHQHGSLRLSHRAGGAHRGGDGAGTAAGADVARARAVRVLQRGGPGSVSAASRRVSPARAAATYGARLLPAAPTPCPTAIMNRYVVIAVARSPARSASFARLSRFSSVAGSR